MTERHCEAIEYDLLVRGFRLRDVGTDQLSWVEYRSLLRGLPPTGDSAYFRARNPKSWWWEPSFDLLAAIVRATQGANWQRSGSQGEPPELLTRPLEEFEQERVVDDDESVPLEDIREVLASRQRRADA